MTSTPVRIDEDPVAMTEQLSSEASLPEAKIELSLNRLAQLFNSLDPAPFHERDLDADAEDYIIGSAEEISRQRPLKLVIHLPSDQVPQSGSHDLGEAIHNYFAYRAAHEQRRLRILFRDGRVALATGLAFLLCCMLLRELIRSFGHDTLTDIVGEGMLIIGWVAMWRPLEMFLYEWVPIRRRCHTLASCRKFRWRWKVRRRELDRRSVFRRRSRAADQIFEIAISDFQSGRCIRPRSQPSPSATIAVV